LVDNNNQQLKVRQLWLCDNTGQTNLGWWWWW